MAANSGTTSAVKNTIATPAALGMKQGNSTVISGSGEVVWGQPSTADTAAGSGIGTSSTSASGGNAMTSGENAMTSGSGSAMTQNMAESLPDGYSGIRDTMRERGAEGMLGWNDATKSVTIGGIDAYKPQYNIDGTTYADSKTINNLTNMAYARSGNPLMGARAYMDSLGLPGSVIWDGESGTVNIGGMVIKPTYVSDGIAYVPKSQLDAAAAAYKSQTGIQTPNGVLSDYNNRYGDRIEAALRELENRDKYSFDPSTNPLYQQYAKEKQKQADAAYRKVLNDNNTSVYGASGAVLSEALAAKNNYLSSIADDWERLENTAYNRYQNETARLRNNLNDTMAVGNDYYGKLYQADADSYARARAGAQDTNNAYQQSFENEQTAAANAAANAYQAAQLGYIGEQTRGLGIANNMSQHDLDTYPEERRLQLDSMGINNRANTAGAVKTELSNEQLMSYLGGGIVSDTFTPDYAAVARALGYTPNEFGIYVNADGLPFSSIDAERAYNGLMNRDTYNAKLGIFYPY